jgi:hypothetical protein
VEPKITRGLEALYMEARLIGQKEGCYSALALVELTIKSADVLQSECLSSVLATIEFVRKYAGDEFAVKHKILDKELRVVQKL